MSNESTPQGGETHAVKTIPVMLTVPTDLYIKLEEKRKNKYYKNVQQLILEKLRNLLE